MIKKTLGILVFSFFAAGVLGLQANPAVVCVIDNSEHEIVLFNLGSDLRAAHMSLRELVYKDAKPSLFYAEIQKLIYGEKNQRYSIVSDESAYCGDCGFAVVLMTSVAEKIFVAIGAGKNALDADTEAKNKLDRQCQDYNTYLDGAPYYAEVDPCYEFSVKRYK